MRGLPTVRVSRVAAALAFCAATFGIAPLQAAETAGAKPSAAASTAAAKRDAPALGFTIERIPVWVQPVVAEAPAGLPAAPVQVLLLDRQIRVEPTGTQRYTHAVRQINDNSGLQKGAQLQVEFDPSYEKLALHQLTVWRGAQRIDKLEPKIVKLLHRETQLERQVVDGRMTASIVLDDLRVGDRIEWAASVRGDNPVFGGRFVSTEWSRAEIGPVGLLQIRLSAPASRHIDVKVGDPAVQVETQLQGGRRESFYRQRNAAQLRFDPLLPTAEYLKDQIDFSEYADWSEVAAWAEQLFAGATRSSPAIDERVAMIRAGHTTDEARLLAALDFVQREVRYFGTEIGADSHQPASADTVLRQRFGDCKDKVALLTTLLRQLGLQATPLLVSTRYGEETGRRLPSPLAFDHVIAGVVLDGRMLWLDATRAQQTGAPATRQPVGLGQGLLARGGTAVLQALPSTSTALRSEVVDIFRFPKLAEEGTLESATVYHGDFAEWLRDAKANLAAADFEKVFAGDALQAYPTLVADGSPQLEEVPGDNAVKLTLRYRTGAFWKFPEQRALAGNFALLSLAVPLRLPDQTPRTQAMRIATPGRYRHTVRFEFGEPSFAQPSNSRFDESNPQFELHIAYAGQSNEQTITAELLLSAERIEAADWTTYRDRLAKVWPRLSNTMSVPALSPDDIVAVRSELAALDTRLRRGDTRVVTREQVDARVRLILLDKVLGGGRLTPALRGEALVARGVQLDHLGRVDEARLALVEAVTIDKRNAEAHAALAVNALLRRDDAGAIEEADAALLLAPSETGPRYTRAWARYFAGDHGTAQAELKAILQSRSEVERSYGGLWLYLATRRAGGDGRAEMQRVRPSGSKPAWPNPVMQWFDGTIDFDTALAATRDNGQPDRGRECELYFFAAQKALLDADEKQARVYLQKSIATGVVEFTEYALAQRELDRLGPR